MFVMRLVTSSQRGIIHGKSPAAVMFTTCSLPVFGSSSWMYAGLLEDDRAGAGVDRLHVEVGELRHLRQASCVFVSYDQTFATPSRSEMK